MKAILRSEPFQEDLKSITGLQQHPILMAKTLEAKKMQPRQTEESCQRIKIQIGPPTPLMMP